MRTHGRKIFSKILKITPKKFVLMELGWGVNNSKAQHYININKSTCMQYNKYKRVIREGISYIVSHLHSYTLMVE